jgi:hypothetical protein
MSTQTHPPVVMPGGVFACRPKVCYSSGMTNAGWKFSTEELIAATDDRMIVTVKPDDKGAYKGSFLGSRFLLVDATNLTTDGTILAKTLDGYGDLTGQTITIKAAEIIEIDQFVNDEPDDACHCRHEQCGSC